MWLFVQRAFWAEGTVECTGPEAHSCLARVGRGAGGKSEVAHVHCWVTIHPQALVGICVPWLCARCWEEPSLVTGLPQCVLSCANAAGGPATQKGFVGQGIEGP